MCRKAVLCFSPTDGAIFLEHSASVSLPATRTAFAPLQLDVCSLPLISNFMERLCWTLKGWRKQTKKLEHSKQLRQPRIVSAVRWKSRRCWSPANSADCNNVQPSSKESSSAVYMVVASIKNTVFFSNFHQHWEPLVFMTVKVIWVCSISPVIYGICVALN